jgi:transcriptional regulator with XRE-family HTH domain
MSPGVVIKMLRTARGISQTDFAAELGISRTYLSQIEGTTRQPSLNLLKRIAGKLNIPMALLVTDEENADSEIMDSMRRILMDILSASMSRK